MVMAIMLILSAMVMGRYRESRRTALEGAVISTLKALHANQESYRHLNKTYTSDFNELGLVDEGTRVDAAPGSSLQVALLLPPSLAMPFFTDLQEQQQEEGPSKGVGKTKKGGRGGITGPGGGTSGGSGGGRRPGSGGGAGAGTGGPPASGGSSGGGQPVQPPSGGAGTTPQQPTPPPASGGGSSGSGLGSGSGSSGGATSSRCSGGGSCSQLTRHKYIFTLELISTEAFRCTVEPVSDRLISNFFYMDQSGTIRREYAKPATAQSKPL
jgi:type II secretory pathway pseudopilin PulG